MEIGMLKKLKDGDALPYPYAGDESLDDMTDDMEELALLLSCGGIYVRPPLVNEETPQTIHTPRSGTVFLSPASRSRISYPLIDERPRDERSFCQSISRLLLHNPSELSTIITGSFLRSMN